MAVYQNLDLDQNRSSRRWLRNNDGGRASTVAKSLDSRQCCSLASGSVVMAWLLSNVATELIRFC